MTTGSILPLVRIWCVLIYHLLISFFFNFDDKICRNIKMPDKSCKDLWTYHRSCCKDAKSMWYPSCERQLKNPRKIEELEYYQCEINWLSKSHAVDLAGYVICFIWKCFTFIPLAHQIWKTIKTTSNQRNKELSLKV